MSATVLTGSGNISYTNNTGENVRLIIYAMYAYWSPTQTSTTVNQVFTMTINGISFTQGMPATTAAAYLIIGKGLATSVINNGATTTNMGTLGGNGSAYTSSTGLVFLALPTEFVLPPNGTFTTSGTPVGNPPTVAYNILVVPENG